MTFSLKGLKTITNYQYEPACGILSLLDICCSGYYKAFVYALTHGSYPYRKLVKYSAKKLLSALGGGKIAVQLLKQFHELLSTQKVNT